MRQPEAVFLRDKIYELCVGLQGIDYRILYFFHDERTAILAHGLIKEKRVPPKEIDQAVERRILFESDPDKYTYQR